MASVLKVVICLSAVVSGVLSAEGSDWGYGPGKVEPPDWGTVSATCNGERQSPINIFEGNVKREDTLGAFTVSNYNTALSGMKLSNTGTSAKVSLPGDPKVTVTGGGLPGTFEAVQYHFHWGAVSALGSEHLINTQAYPMELHIVHYNKKYTDINEAVTKPDGLAVLGFMFEVSNAGNTNYDDLVNGLMDVLSPNAETSLNPATLESILPDEFATSPFYRYLGSLTTPGCQESVIWTVFRNPIKISNTQLEAFRLIQDDTSFGIVNNFRPVQKLYSREVTANFDPDLHWSYDTELVTVDHWKDYYSDCGAESQSPINIVSGLSEQDDYLDDFHFEGYNHTSGMTMKLVNKGHAAQVDVSSTNPITISKGNLSESFSLAQFHFHWGSEDDVGSEHFLDSVSYPMEVHFVHYKTSLGSLGAAATTPGGLAVLGFMFEIAETANVELVPIIEKLTLIKDPDASVTIDPIVLENILPQSPKNFYRYSGSLTTPGCFETVTWSVFEETIPISKEQLAAFRLLLSSDKDDKNQHKPMVNNYRPPQPINGRRITRNFELSSGPSWTYVVGEYGPEHWNKFAAVCDGIRQSPINIVNEDVIYDDPQVTKIPGFTFENYDVTQNIRWKLSNSGHSVKVEVDDPNFYKLTGGDLPGTFHLVQFHFHWGADNSQGSEHTIDGRMYPMEVHFVHYNAGKYGSISEALGFDDGLAVLGFMFEVSSTTNTKYAPLVNLLKKVKNPKSHVAMPTMKMNDLMANNKQDFYRYQGSLTTPTCNEAVTWTLFKESIKISELQLQEFRSLLSSDKNPDTSKYIDMVNNYRPVQRRNSRKVRANFLIGGTGAASGLHHIHWLALCMCAVLARLVCRPGVF